jgi:hypothetical protein
MERNDAPIPEGRDFLALVQEHEDLCEAKTDEHLPSMGKKAPVCVDRIGTVLSLLDRMSSCWWVCRGGDHTIEYLAGRTLSNARAALRLLRFGFYDEALLLCRSMGEIANLLYLFFRSDVSLTEWRNASHKERLRHFSPQGNRI